jgi:hypothetical protein
MIEMRVVDNGLMCRPDFQYRYMKFAIDPPSGCLCPDYGNDKWSDWKTAEWIKADDYKEWIEPEET